MIHVKIKVKHPEWKAVHQWPKHYARAMVGAMAEATNVLRTRIFLNLSGPSHTLFPGNGNPFPGTVTGRMKNSITARIGKRPGRILGIVGPNVFYAIYHVLGRGVPKRDFLTAAFKTSRRKVSAILRRGVKDAMG